MRVALVTPFAWSQPHDVNEHVAGAADGLRALGHDVTVIAPSTRSADLHAGRRALQRGEMPEVLAIGTALPVSRASSVGLPVGTRATLAHALHVGRFDIVHGFEPGLPSLAYVALTEATCLTAATFLSPERLSVVPGRAARDRLRIRVDALLATSEVAAAAAEEELPGSYLVIPAGVDTALFSPGEKRRLIAIQLELSGRPLARAALRALDELEGWDAVCIHTKPLGVRPAIPARLRERVGVRAARHAADRAGILAPAAIFVPVRGGHTRLGVEAAAAGCAIVEPPESETQPELVTAALARLGEDARHLADEQVLARRRAEPESFAALATALDSVYASMSRKPRTRKPSTPLGDRERILVDLHMHTSASHDCSIDPVELVEHAESIGLGAIAVTDHNVFDGAVAAHDAARSRDLVVIPGEEMKTDGQGEIIGLFLHDRIPRGLSFADTIAAIREQEGIVYVPHPFDRRHAIPDPATLHRHVSDIDVLEVYNARLLKEAYNDEALRFARKYGLLQGAGSDAHVLPGVGTGALDMLRFDDPEEFLVSLRTAAVVRRPKSLAYLQSLKWVAQVKEKVR